LWFVAWPMLALAVSLRIFGVLTGVLYGESRITLATAVAVGAALVVVALWPERRKARRNRRNQPDPEDRPDRVTRINLLIGTATALLASLSLLLPAVPSSAAETSCRGAPLQGANYIATTQEIGANARSGPGESFEQAYRFSGKCSLGFDGYCLGESTNDAFFHDWFDNRWLVIPHHAGWAHAVATVLSGEPDEERFVAAGVVFAQSPESNLHLLDAARCGPGAAKPPGQARLTATVKPAEVILTARADRTFNYGFALWLGSADTTGQHFRQIAAGPGTTATWKTASTAGTLTSPATITVVAMPCLAPSVPAEDPAAAAVAGFHVEPTGTVTKLPAAPTIDGPTRDRLIRTACQSPS
jgi:hypothetical protein